MKKALSLLIIFSMLASNSLFCYADNIETTINDLKEQASTDVQFDIAIDDDIVESSGIAISDALELIEEQNEIGFDKDEYVNIDGIIDIGTDEDLDTATISELAHPVFGLSNDWYYYISGGDTIHYTNNSAVTGATQITYNADGDITYTGFTIYNITTAIFDDIVKPTSIAKLFYEFQNLATISNVSNLDTSDVTNMSYAFGSCTSLRTIDVSNFDTSNVTDMSQMFLRCNQVETLDLSSFNTSNVTTMQGMFSECSSLIILDVSSLDTSNVTNMNSMFNECTQLPSLNITNFVTTNVTDMGWMFCQCNDLASIDLSHFNTNKVTIMQQMFTNCTSMASLDLSSFNTQNVESMGYMFSSCGALTSLNISNFNTSKVTSMTSMFRNCSSLTSINLSSFDTSKVTSMQNTFAGCATISNLDLRNFNTSIVTNMNSMFNGCNRLVTIKVSSQFDTSSVTSSTNMFLNCNSLFGGYTTFDNTIVDKTRAVIDSPTTPGYFEGVGIDSISILTPPSKTNYDVGQTFNPQGLVITVTYDDAVSVNVSYESQPSNFTFNPTTTVPLDSFNNNIEIIYFGKTTNQAIAVNSSNNRGGGGGTGGGGSADLGLTNWTTPLNQQNNIPQIDLNGSDLLKNVLYPYNGNSHNPFYNVTDTYNYQCYGTWQKWPLSEMWFFHCGDPRNNYASNGYVCNGWYYIGLGTNYGWYHFNAIGIMDIGWYQEGQNTFYLNSDPKDSDYGKMLTGIQLIDGAYRDFGTNGILVGGK